MCGKIYQATVYLQRTVYLYENVQSLTLASFYIVILEVHIRLEIHIRIRYLGVFNST